MRRIILAAFWLSSTCVHGQIIAQQTHILNYSNPSTIEKYKKLEIGVALDEQLKSRIKEFLEPGSFSGLSPLNPFLDWELDVQATFKHAATNTLRKRDFFYYHDFTQEGNRWSDIVNESNQFPMRVRFAPSEAGEWSMETIIRYDDTTINIPAFYFNVNENNHPGFVKVHQNKRNFQLGDKIVFPIGHVFPGPYNRAAGGKVPWGDPPNNDPSKNTTVADWNAFHGDIENYVMQGGKSIKLIQTSYGNLIEFEEKGNYFKRMHYAWEQDKIMDLCEKNGVLINFNLLFQDVIMAYGQNGSVKSRDTQGKPQEFWGDPWDYSNYGGDGQRNLNDYFPTYCYFVEGQLPSHMFLTPELMAYHKQRTRYYISRYGYSPQIYTWELMSEILHMDAFGHGTIDLIDVQSGMPMQNKPAQIKAHPGNNVAIEAINTYHNEISTYIKGELDDTDHLIAMNIAPIEPDNIDNYILDCAFNPAIDIIGFNFYSNRPDKLIIGKPDKNGKNNLDIENEKGKKETSEFVRLYEQHERYKKPIILGEVGHDFEPFTTRCFKETGNIIDVMTYGFCGIAAMHPWEGYVYSSNETDYDQRLLWPSSISSEKHMNSEKVISILNNLDGNWQQGRQIEKLYSSDPEFIKELQYFLSEDKTSATGYVKNRSFNVHTSRTNDDCFAAKDLHGFDDPLQEHTPVMHDEGRGMFTNNALYIAGLEKKTWYKVTWYDFISGIEISPVQTQRSDSKSRLELQHPMLSLEQPQRPILWFVVEKANDAQ